MLKIFFACGGHNGEQYQQLTLEASDGWARGLGSVLATLMHVMQKVSAASGMSADTKSQLKIFFACGGLKAEVYIN